MLNLCIMLKIGIILCILSNIWITVFMFDFITVWTFNTILILFRDRESSMVDVLYVILFYVYIVPLDYRIINLIIVCTRQYFTIFWRVFLCVIVNVLHVV